MREKPNFYTGLEQHQGKICLFCKDLGDMQFDSVEALIALAGLSLLM